VSEAFLVAIKPSARRTNGAVGRTVNRSGTRHRFDSRVDAEVWAAGLASRGGTAVWIREANPNDDTDVDAYLMGRRHDPDRTRREGVDQTGVLEYATRQE
jgi:hypothetical protein